MLPQARQRILEGLPSSAEVLQVAAAAEPFGRADWVLDDLPYDARADVEEAERFTRRTWTVRDVCDREPWPFADGRFDFAVCTQLAALRDPVGVCRELARVARAGYVEVPTVEDELSAGIEGSWIGHAAHRWLCDVVDGELVFTHKPASLHGDPRVRVPERWHGRLRADERVNGLFWEQVLPARERVAPDGHVRAELVRRVRTRFEPSPVELVGAEILRLGTGVVRSALGLLRPR